MRPSSSSSLSLQTSAKLFVTGATVGPLVDSLHNQCLLRYDVLPIQIPNYFAATATTTAASTDISTTTGHYLLASSWTVPPLLGIAYVVLGGILPRVFEFLLLREDATNNNRQGSVMETRRREELKQRAILAVGTTALIIKLSEFLETTSNMDDAVTNVMVLLLAALGQWAILDGSLSALLAASITAIGGPLSELPFVGHGIWVYLDSARDYFPLANWDMSNANYLWTWLFGVSDYNTLGLSSITGPCYFAVTMDAIALGRWFDAMEEDKPRSS